MQVPRWKFAVIAVVTAVFLGFYTAFPETLGIDLAGGTELRYDLDLSNVPPHRRTPAITKATADVLSRRLDSLGLAEMTIRPVGDYSIMIQLPGVSSTRAEQIKEAIRTSGDLWFKIVHQSADPHEVWLQRHRTDPVILDTINEILERKDRGEYIADEEAFDVATYEIRDKTGHVLESFPILLENDDAVPGKYLAGADPDRDEYGGPAVAFYMKPEGAARLAETTERNVGKAMAIVLDGVVVSAPKIRSTISDRGQITGSFTKEEVDTLITVLRSGALPAKPKLASEDTIAPTLGEDSIRRGMFAVVTGVILTFLFMFVYYRLAGAVANFALVLNLIILFGTMHLLGATLTLPGIAGIVLVMGMAVDANILINERIREEFGRGVPITEAVAAGYRHAFSAIIDSNITTVLTAIILYMVGTGPIRGFAVTLMIGIVSSLFTALWVTRVLFDWLLEKGWYTEPRYLSFLADTNIPFLKKRRPYVIAALVLLNLGFVAFAMRGPDKYGIDFNGGAVVRMRLAKPLSTAEVRERMAKFERDGKHPYKHVDVQRIGETDEQGRARVFQLLVAATEIETVTPKLPSAEAQTRSAESKKVADEQPPSEPQLIALDEEDEESEEAGPPSLQEVFLRDIEAAFNDVLLPEPFGEPKFETKGQGPSRRLVIELEVRLDPERGKELSAEEVQSTLRGLASAPDNVTASAGIDPFVAIQVERAGDRLVLRTGALDFDAPRDKVVSELKDAVDRHFGKQIATPFPFKNAVGASVAQGLRARGILAVLLSLLMIILYIAFRFEFKAGVAAAMCLFHDVCVTLGFMMLFDLTSQWTGIDAKINLTTIAAFLTIVGYSINDTIVTFDRIRENLAKVRNPDREYEMERAINQMLSRTVLTSFTVFMVLVVLALAGVSTLMGFTLALIVGVVFGTFSSIFVATPILLTDNRTLRKLVLFELALVVGVSVLSSFV